MPAPLRFSDAAAAARNAAATALAAGEGAAGAARAVGAEADRFLALAGDMLGLNPVLSRLACSAGCAWCCHQIVGVTGAELALVRQAVAALPADLRAAVARRAAEARTKGAGLDQGQWWSARIPCPLLGDDRLCLVHAVRPMPCRAHTSADALACKRSLDGEPVRTPVLAAQQGIYGHAQAGLARALQQAGHDAGVVNLALALIPE